MAPGSRFEHVETAPEGEGADVQPTRPSLERFGEQQEHEAPHQHDQVDAMRPAHGSESLRRFDADGADGVGLELGPDHQMPLKRCHLCNADLSKFQNACHVCGASMDSEEARAFNLKLWAEQKAAREAEEKADLERMYARVNQTHQDQQALREAAHGMARELGASYGAAGSGSGRESAWVVVGVAVLVALVWHHALVQLVCGVVALGAVLWRYPELRQALMRQRTRRR